MLEIVPVVDFDTLEIRAWAERERASQQGLCRLTTLLMPVRAVDGSIAVQTRPPRESHAGKRDFFGGWVCLEQEAWSFLLGQPLEVGSLVRSAAIREANEGLRMVDGRGLPELLNAGNVDHYLFRIQDVGSFPWRKEQRSTLYLVRIPADSSIRPMDDVEGAFIRVETEFHRLEAVLQKYERREWQFADGAERVLQRFLEGNDLLQAVRQVIAVMGSPN